MQALSKSHRQSPPNVQGFASKRAHKHFISGGRLFGLLLDSILEGVGDSLLTATDRCTYTVSVPRMYNIVGREGVKALRPKNGRKHGKPAASNKL